MEILRHDFDQKILSTAAVWYNLARSPMEKVSIALCTYNGAHFLEEQLQSYLRQHRLPDELIVCDDRSEDLTIEILNHFAKDAPFPVSIIINERNLGSTKNFEKAISRCGGDLIFLSDQDDVWLPEKIAFMVSAFEKNAETALLFSNAELVEKDLKPINLRLWDRTFPHKWRKRARNGKMFETLLWQNVVTGSTVAFRSQFREVVLPIPNDIPNLIHDGWIALILAIQERVNFLDEPLILYRQHSGQQLGLGLPNRGRSSSEERRESFSALIGFLENEVTRLSRVKELSIVPKEAAELIEEFLLRKQQMIVHLTARRDLPSGRARRFIPILREFLSGRYHYFSRGFLSMAKDLFQSW